MNCGEVYESGPWFKKFCGDDCRHADDDVVLKPSTVASDVDGWDSVSNIELMVALEKEFEIRFNTGEMASLANVGQLLQRIATRLNT